ncbi:MULTISPECIES: cell division protein FtsQ/DivIB [Allobacillus]|uniref:Cell division protein DivIB n=1 Tax=Allobacillus salarius TaxID=1955272 RepID=A0A556PRQ1_9BACI|nr:FtsQ-type POTRA domain-containing protein [Allobacillus salarius]TSJ67067.1 FtsQ-type POTRA domain-containing protein [Allobacillus salarius]
MADKKIISIEDRIPQLKKARKRKANRRFVMYLTIILILVLVIVYIQSPLSYVKNIDVKGNHRVEESEVIDLSKISMDENYWGVELDAAKDLILQHPEISSVEIDRKWYNGYEITISELARVAYIREGDHYYPILEDGTMLKDQQLDQPLGDAPLLHDFNSPEMLRLLTEQLEKLPESINQLLSEIYWIPNEINDYKILIYTADGHEVIASIRDFSSKIKLYPSIASQIQPNQEGVIHIDVGAYFQPYSSEEEASTQEDQVESEQ